MPGVSQHPYASFLDQVEKPTRYIGGEYQQVLKPAGGRRGAGLPGVPRHLRDRHVPPRDEDPVLGAEQDRRASPASARSRPGWTWRPSCAARPAGADAGDRRRRCADFDVLGFSLQYELTYTNVLTLLDLSAACPLRARRLRGDDGAADPGGRARPPPTRSRWRRSSTPSSSARPRRRCRRCAWRRRRCAAQGVPRRERLIRLAAKYPLYVPELYATERRRRDRVHGGGRAAGCAGPGAARSGSGSRTSTGFPFPDDSPLPYSEAIFDRMAVEVARGCTEGCRFCQAG